MLARGVFLLSLGMRLLCNLPMGETQGLNIRKHALRAVFFMGLDVIFLLLGFYIDYLRFTNDYFRGIVESSVWPPFCSLYIIPQVL